MNLFTDYKYKQDQKVKFDLGVVGVKGEGHIVGCSTIPSPVIGATYMVQVTKSDAPIPSETYPFNTISVFECQLSSVEA